MNSATTSQRRTKDAGAGLHSAAFRLIQCGMLPRLLRHQSCGVPILIHPLPELGCLGPRFMDHPRPYERRRSCSYGVLSRTLRSCLLRRLSRGRGGSVAENQLTCRMHLNARSEIAEPQGHTCFSTQTSQMRASAECSSAETPTTVVLALFALRKYIQNTLYR